MRSLSFATAVAVLSLLAANPAQAQEARPGPYAGLILSQISYDQSGATAATLTSLGGVLGQVISAHWALEARLGIGLDEERISLGTVPVDLALDHASGLVKGILPLAPRFGIYGLAGFTIGKFRTSTSGLYVDKWESDFSYGAGAEFGFLPNMSFGAEWLRLFEGSGYRVDAASMTLNFRF